MERYHLALKKELTLWGNPADKANIRTIFFGGGTPSTYPSELLLDTFGTIKDVVNMAQRAEVTIEVNPGTVRKEQLELWKSIGINRLSIGVQYAKDRVLQALNRHHSKDDVMYVLELAPKFFENISVDLMLGLPGVSERAWKEFVKEVVTWPISHVSLYCLMLHENTSLFFRVQRNNVVLPEDSVIRRLYLWTVDFLAKHGIYQYEVSNFARKGCESLHNLAYWKRHAYKGFGLAACSFDGINRTQNESNLTMYLSKVESGILPVNFSEKLTESDERLEKIMLGLRRITGIPCSLLKDGVSKSTWDMVFRKVLLFEEQGLLVRDGDNIRLTTTGFIVENELITELSRE